VANDFMEDRIGFSVLSEVPSKATRVNRAGPGYKVIRLRRLSHTRQALQSSYPRPKSLDLPKRVVAALPRWRMRAVSNSFAAISSSSFSLAALISHPPARELDKAAEAELINLRCRQARVSPKGEFIQQIRWTEAELPRVGRLFIEGSMSSSIKKTSLLSS